MYAYAVVKIIRKAQWTIRTLTTSCTIAIYVYGGLYMVSSHLCRNLAIQLSVQNLAHKIALNNYQIVVNIVYAVLFHHDKQ